MHVSEMAATGRCFHCGLDLPANEQRSVVIEGVAQPMCCAGCQAVAEAIVAAGLENFYHHRTEYAARPDDAEALIPESLRLFDREDIQRDFVRDEGTLREASLLLEGIRCAACIWLNERHISDLPGVATFSINYSTHRATLRFDPAQIQLSQVLSAIRAIGYTAHPYDPTRLQQQQRNERAIALRHLAVAAVGSMQVMMLSVALYNGEDSGMSPAMLEFLRWVSLLLTAPVLAYAGQSFFRGAMADLRRGRPGMDVPVALALALAFAASVLHTVQGQGEIYFDSVTMFVFFLLSGRFFEMSARHRAAEVSEALNRLQPSVAERLNADGQSEQVAVAELMLGDRLRVAPGAVIPADGCIERGRSSIDASMLTGESLPQSCGIGDEVIGGTLNLESPLELRVSRVGEDSVLASVVRLLERAQGDKPRIAAFADRVARYFVVVVLLLALAVFAFWWGQAPERALEITVALLVVSCPCALSLATPTALTAATGALTTHGLLVSRAHALETLACVTHVVFDKTGTLTTGRLELERIEVADAVRCDRERALALALALEQGSEHPVAQALRRAHHSTPSIEVQDLRNHPGQGIEGWVDDRRYRLGSAAFCQVSISTDDGTGAEAILADEQGLLARFYLSDEVRADAAQAVAKLQQQGIGLSLLSGDRETAVAALAQRLGIAHYAAAQLPADKLEAVQQLQARGEVVAMVGDGINDAPVLAGAQVSIAMGSGTQLAHASADMVLMGERLQVLVQGVDSARRCLHVIRQNHAWALGYNILALPFAAAGWVAPWMAAIGMSLSSLLVVVNAARLRRGEVET